MSTQGTATKHITRSTFTSALRADVGVVGGVGMPLRASYLCLVAPTKPAQHAKDDVLTMWHGPQVLRIHTGAIAAKMVKFVGGRDRSLDALEGPAMGQHDAPRTVSPATNNEHAVTAGVPERCPDPTTIGLLYFAPKALVDGHPFFHNPSITIGSLAYPVKICKPAKHQMTAGRDRWTVARATKMPAGNLGEYQIAGDEDPGQGEIGNG